ncbi:2'-5' RNA ligase family protein [Actinokineospora enzanensis]|uniref:2'-5' RNA ligase family protein n=1 Tax=Actinokineospora enzanensis TaxID=155975 RepID=UPI00036673A0|nr:2'-5' RNA ligase family protein [Actinokineospora enzanensis]
MTRYFSAFDLPDEVADDLAAHLPPIVPPLRPTPRHQWHVTVGYYGDVDPGRRMAELTERVTGLLPARLRVEGAGTFGGVAFGKITSADWGALAILAEAAGQAEGGHQKYVPHVTVARWPREHPVDLSVAAALRDYRGPEWVPRELVLYASEGGIYTRVGAVRLLADYSGMAGC